MSQWRVQQNKMSFIYFRVTAQTSYNQVVRICGNHAAIGNWNPLESIELSTNALLYPVWTHSCKVQIENGTNVQFKCIIQDGNNMYWEDVANRSIVLNYVKNHIEIKFNKVEMIVRKFQKCERSIEYTQDVLDQVERMKVSRDYDPNDPEVFDSSESDLESFRDLLAKTSIKELDQVEEMDWDTLIWNYFNDKTTQMKQGNSLQSQMDNYNGSLRQLRKASHCGSNSNIPNETYVICACLKIPIKITVIREFHQVDCIQDIPNKYRFELTSDPYYSSQYEVFANRLNVIAIWVGWIGLTIQSPNELKLVQQYLFQEYYCYGIVMDGYKYINGCFGNYLDPIFNNLQVRYSEVEVDEFNDFSNIFKNVFTTIIDGNKFSDYLFSNILHTIFVIDYHLCLLPILLSDVMMNKKEERPRLCTIFNRPYPNPSNLKLIANYDQIISKYHDYIDSLLSNDMISFISTRDIQQFIQSLPQQYRNISKQPTSSAHILHIMGRQIVVDCGLVGLNHNIYQQFLANKQHINEIPNLLLSVDRLSIYAGLEQKFKLMQHLNIINPQIQLIQVLYVTNDTQLNVGYMDNITRIVELINSQADREIIKLEFNTSHQQIMMYCVMAVAFLKTCLRESNSLNYLEYVYLRQQRKLQPRLILGEWCKQKLPHLLINIYKISESAQLIQNYITKPQTQHVYVPNSSDWLNTITEHLNECENFNGMIMYSTQKDIPIGLKYRHNSKIETHKAVEKYNKIQPAFQRVFIVNYCHQIHEKYHNTIIYRINPTNQLSKSLEQLTRHCNNTVIIVSNLTIEMLELLFGDIQGLYIIAQEGQYIKQNGNNQQFHQVHNASHLQIQFDQINKIIDQRCYKTTVVDNSIIISIKEKVEPGCIAFALFQQQLINQLQNELSDCVIVPQLNSIKVQCKFTQIDELIKMIMQLESGTKGLVSFATIVSWDSVKLDLIARTFENHYINQKRIINQKFHCVSISGQIDEHCNLVLQNAQDIVKVLQMYTTDNAFKQMEHGIS